MPTPSLSFASVKKSLGKNRITQLSLLSASSLLSSGLLRSVCSESQCFIPASILGMPPTFSLESLPVEIRWGLYLLQYRIFHYVTPALMYRDRQDATKSPTPPGPSLSCPTQSSKHEPPPDSLDAGGVHHHLMTLTSFVLQSPPLTTVISFQKEQLCTTAV